MNHISIALASILYLLSTQFSYAYDPIPYTCTTAYSPRSYFQEIKLNTTIAIPESAPAGTIIWRMPTKNMNYSCYLGTKPFEVHAFFNPFNRDLGPDVAVGVTINGTDYYPSTTKKIHMRNLPTNGAEHGGQIDINEINSYNVSLFIVKKSKPKSTPKNSAIVINGYIPYSIGNENNQKLSIEVAALNDVRIIPCTSTVRIHPNTIDFGHISTLNAIPEREITRTAFTISEQRQCESPSSYGLSGKLQPSASASLYDNLTTLVPNDNNSVGINILDAETGKQIRFNDEFIITPRQDISSNSKHFEARLKWRTKTPKLGVFNAGAILDVYYK